MPVRSAGFSLVELMVAMVLGLLLIGGSIAIFSGNMRSSGLSQAITQLQGNARFVLDDLSAGIRAAGFRGCSVADDSILTLSTSVVPASTLVAESIRGAEIQASGWVPSGPPGYVAPVGAGAPVVGTQALMLQYAVAPGHLLTTSMTGNNASMRIQGPADDLFAGDLALIANCNSVDVFRIAAISGTGSLRTVTPEESLSQPYVLPPAFPQNTRVYPFVSRIYYIGDTGRTDDSGDPVYSLYRHDLPYNVPASNPPLELVEGVDQLQMRFGLQDGDRTRYVNAGSLVDPGDFTLVQLGILMSSHQRFAETDPGRVYTLAGRQVVPAGSSAITTGPEYPADTRIRLPFSMTIKIRNRGLAGS